MPFQSLAKRRSPRVVGSANETPSHIQIEFHDEVVPRSRCSPAGPTGNMPSLPAAVDQQDHHKDPSTIDPRFRSHDEDEDDDDIIAVDGRDRIDRGRREETDKKR